METKTNLIDFLISEFGKHKKFGDKINRVTERRVVVHTTTEVSIFLKSGNKFVSSNAFHYFVMKYPTQKEPVVKISKLAYDGFTYDFPEEIIVIPIESIESVSFEDSYKIGIRYYSKNKNKL